MDSSYAVHSSPSYTFVKYIIALVWVPTDCIISHNVGVFASDRNELCSVLQSRVHEYFAIKLSSGLEERPGYRPSDGFEPFPFPPYYSSNEEPSEAGGNYYGYRARLMDARNEGLTATYNRFHDPDE